MTPQKSALRNLNHDAVEVLRDIVREWVDEGFQRPPYDPAYYDVFEALDLDPAQNFYNIERPVE